jgi:hypothetical protein
MCWCASSAVRCLGDRPRWLRYRLRLADSVDVSYRGFPEITVQRFVRARLDIFTDGEVDGCVKQFGNHNYRPTTMTRLVPDGHHLADTCHTSLCAFCSRLMATQ